MDSRFDFSTIGLEIRDRRVYETLIANPGSSLRKIAADTGINRGSVYESIKSLVEHGLVGSIEIGKQRRYTAADPSIIPELIREEREKLSGAERRAEAYVESLAKLSPSVDNDVPPFATFYEDHEGIATVLRDIIATCKLTGHTGYRAISTKGVREYIYHNFPNFTQRRIDAGLTVRVIAAGQGGSADDLSERRWLPATRGDAPNCYTLIYGSKTAFITIDTRSVLSAIVIDNDGVAQLQKELFDRLWLTLK